MIKFTSPATTAKFFHLASLLMSVIVLAWAEAPFSGGPVGVILLGGTALGLIYLMVPPPAKPINDLAGYFIGGVIAVVGSAWIAVRLNLIWAPSLPSWIAAKDELSSIPVQLAIIPCIGPLLPPLLLIKLMVRQLPRDFWVEQSIGLVLICLASVLCSDLFFGMMIMGYFLLVMAALAHHELADSESHSPFHLAPADLAPANWRQKITRWFSLSLAASLGVFFLLPRFDLPAWDPLERFTNKRFQAGYSDQIDINDKGQIALSDQLAFTVECKGPNGPGVLPENQLFRGSYLEHYQDGVWSRRTYRLGKSLPLENRSMAPPPGMLQLTFRVEPYRVGGVFLADPMETKWDGAEPITGVVVRKQDRLVSTFILENQTVLPNPYISRVRGEVIYQQLIRTAALSERRWAIGGVTMPQQLQELLYVDNPELTKLTLNLLRDCGTDLTKGGISFEIPKDPDLFQFRGFPNEFHEEIAKALAFQLRNSGKFSYSLDIVRGDESIDPALDFLSNTRRGHCELFASSLVLMLRSINIPARVVTGYKGADKDEDQIYYVRQRNAHAWAEVLLPRLDRLGNHINDRVYGLIWDWMTLDPTPDSFVESADPTITGSVQKWFQESQEAGERLWRVLFIDYNAEAAIEQLVTIWQRGPMRRALITLLITLFLFGGILSIFAIRWFFAYRRKYAAWQEKEHPWLSLIRVMGNRGMHPSPGQTPREFATEIAHRFDASPDLQPWSELPVELVGVYQRERFGGEEGPGDHAASKAQVRELEEFILQNKLQNKLAPATWTSSSGKTS